MINELTDQERPTSPASRGRGKGAAAILSSEDLLDGRAEVMIEHNGEIYRLRHTRQGKLILTK